MYKILLFSYLCVPFILFSIYFTFNSVFHCCPSLLILVALIAPSTVPVVFYFLKS